MDGLELVISSVPPLQFSRAESPPRSSVPTLSIPPERLARPPELTAINPLVARRTLLCEIVPLESTVTDPLMVPLPVRTPPAGTENVPLLQTPPVSSSVPPVQLNRAGVA